MRDRPGVRQGQQVESHSHRWPYRLSGPVTGISVPVLVGIGPCFEQGLFC